jgi:hypothetical protein
MASALNNKEYPPPLGRHSFANWTREAVMNGLAPCHCEASMRYLSRKYLIMSSKGRNLLQGLSDIVTALRDCSSVKNMTGK